MNPSMRYRSRAIPVDADARKGVDFLFVYPCSSEQIEGSGLRQEAGRKKKENQKEPHSRTSMRLEF
jgi:hypothetical protein